MAEVNVRFHGVIGQNRVQSLIGRALEQNRLPHAMLFHGPAGVGKDALVVGLAMHALCERKTPGGCGDCAACGKIRRLEHPAFRLILPLPPRPKSMPEKKYHEIVREKTSARMADPYADLAAGGEASGMPVIGIEEIRNLKHETSLKLSTESMRTVLVSHAERMTVAAANSVLKLLEEPPANTAIVLTSSAPGQLLPTIASRCQQVRFDLLTEAEIEDGLGERGIEPEKASRISRMAGGSLGRALGMLDPEYDALRDAAWSWLNLEHGDWPGQLDWIRESADRWSKPEIIEILHVLEAIFRDRARLETDGHGSVMQSDRLDALQRFCVKHPKWNPETAISAVRRAIDLIEKNVYISLVLFELKQEFQNAMG
jgi:DNA polymerase-3 subunit delta'